MMKIIRYLLIFIFLFTGKALAIDNGNTLLASLILKVSTNICADCSGNASFMWEINNTTVGSGTPCGCSDGDTSMTQAGDATITGGTLVADDTSSNNGNDYYSATISGDDLVDDTVGTVFIRFKVDTWANDTVLFNADGDANDKIRIFLVGADDLRGNHNENGSSKDVQLAGNAVSTGTEWILRYRWQVDAGNDHQITLYNTSMVQQDDDTDNDTIAALTAQPSTLYIGNSGATSGYNFTIYYVHVYKAWVDTDSEAP